MELFRPITPENIGCIHDLLHELLEENGVVPGGRNEGRTDFDYIINNMAKGLELQPGSIMVDDTDNPKAIFWGYRQESLMLRGAMYVVALVFISKKGEKGLSKKTKNILESIEQAARFNGCERVLGACCYDTERQIYEQLAERMWTKNGYVKQESFFTKKI